MVSEVSKIAGHPAGVAELFGVRKAPREWWQKCFKCEGKGETQEA